MGTCAAVLARFGGTLVDILVAVRAAETRLAGAHVRVRSIGAVATVLTWNRRALVDIGATGRSGIPGWAGARERRNLIRTDPSVAARTGLHPPMSTAWRADRTIIDVFFAICAAVSR